MQQNPYQNDYTYNAPTPVYNPYAQNLSIIKDYLKGGKTLFVFIVLCISAVLTIVIAVNNFLSLDMQKAYAQYLTSIMQQSMPDYPANAIYSSTLLSTVSSTLSSLVSFTVNIVAWALIYFKSKNPNPASSPKAGIIILFVLSIISLVTSIASGALIALCSLVLLSLPLILRSDPSVNLTDYVGFSTVCYTLACVFILLAVFLILYSIGQFNFFRSIKNSLSSNQLYNKGAKLYGVMSVIMTVILAISCIALFLTAFIIPYTFEQMPTDYASFAIVTQYTTKIQIAVILIAVLCLVSALSGIAYARFAFGYNKYINTIMQAPPMIDLNGNGDFSDEVQPGEYNINQGEIPMGVCPQCRQRIKHDGMFCDNCGYRLK